MLVPLVVRVTPLVVTAEGVVGMGSTIGANVFLTTSVPPRSFVVQKDANVKVLNKRDREKTGGDFHI